MPKPRGIVVVSAHWENAPLAITSPAAGTPLYYDFGGFHPRYYTLPYATPDATALARQRSRSQTRGRICRS
jgi:4,5-DOPA dioxygenase extradiol